MSNNSRGRIKQKKAKIMNGQAEVWIPLTRGKVAVIDFDDFEKVRGIKWQAKRSRNTFYAVASGKRVNGKQPFLQMHRILMGALPGERVDHEDGDGLNNRRTSNLRRATNQQNMFNQRHRKGTTSSQFKGVSWRKDSCCWRAYISINGKRNYLGIFENEIDAARAYDQKAMELFGEYAAPNFPDQKQCQSLINSGSAA